MPATPTEILPVKTILQPADEQEAARAVEDCYQNETAVYPIGGATSLDFGLPAKQPGIGLSLENLDRVIDYPARDMTITVEAGITMQTLADTLAKENQQFPVDVPFPAEATLGGVTATNFNGPRRYGYGAVRDHIIGITAIDGRGRVFHGGGRVVKNVAGYDFCKLLTGSMGSLGVITQLTLKLKPAPQQSMLTALRLDNLAQGENVLASLSSSQTAPAAIELLMGPAWQEEPLLQIPAAANGTSGQPKGARGDVSPTEEIWVVVGLEGSAADVNWMRGRLEQEWREHVTNLEEHVITFHDQPARDLWRRLADFPACDLKSEGAMAPLTIKASLPPSRVTTFIETVRQVDANCSVMAHAGNGIVLAKFSQFPPQGLSRTLVAQIQPAAAQWGGYVTVLSNPDGAEMTHQVVWGAEAGHDLMAAVKKQFDPKNLLNPGRFVC